MLCAYLYVCEILIIGQEIRDLQRLDNLTRLLTESLADDCHGESLRASATSGLIVTDLMRCFAVV